ncbi:hypothetical protein O6H91_06G044700 [Diphasiastrum complanatum]|uniref:Uncharacterized protein n=1 Tax=Diphasiastrum complanatum TaxID=34168 RepID=A0ACC2DD08_DIPCM|nr:hypothetical protein O6H91_06G044700 [Diphasiastrum complanatum]
MTMDRVVIVTREQEDVAATSKKKKNICSTCPQIKRLRDECIIEHGLDACKSLIDAHLRCLRAEGFNILAHLRPVLVGKRGLTLLTPISEWLTCY